MQSPAFRAIADQKFIHPLDETHQAQSAGPFLKSC